MTYNTNNLSNFLKTIRQTTMYNQSEVAEAVGITVQSYSKYENGLREPSVEVLYKLAHFFKVSPVLFFISDYPLEGEVYKENEFMILSIISANFEKYKWLTNRFKEQNIYSPIGDFGHFKYIRKNEKELIKVKSSLFRMYGDIISLKRDLLKEIETIEEQTKNLIEELDQSL